MPPQTTSLRSILILSYRFCLWSLSLRFPNQTLNTPLTSAIHATGPAHLIHLITQTIQGEEQRSLSSSLTSFLQLVPPRPKYSPQHPILKHDQPTLLSQCKRPSLTPTQHNRKKLLFCTSKSLYYCIFMLTDSCVMMKLMTVIASSDKHHYRSSDSFFNIDANGFQIKFSTVLMFG